MMNCVPAAAVAYTAYEAWHHENYEQCCDMLLLLGYGHPAMNPTSDADTMRRVAEWIYKLEREYREEWGALIARSLLSGPYGKFDWGDSHSPSLANPHSELHQEVLRCRATETA
jgi:hypothetical protein